MPPGSRRNRARSRTRPVSATSVRGQRAVLIPNPLSLASEAETTSFQGRHQSADSMGIRPTKALNSLTTLLHNGTTS
eukprot:12220368-Heterocapsa_arctica.AAC.1